MEPGDSRGAPGDAIYSEAICEDEVFYHGSEDEDYSDSEARRVRYEAAGQQYLDGRIPFLLSASLRGPFDQASGWANPWKSMQRCESNPPLPPTYSGCRQKQTATKPPHRAHECHLPSPESLRQAPASGPHLYLKSEGLLMVQRWRENIQAPSLSQDLFWASSNAPQGSSAKKKRGAESAWLKRTAGKRRKTDSTDRRMSKLSSVASTTSEPQLSPSARQRRGRPSAANAPRRTTIFEDSSSQSEDESHGSYDSDLDGQDGLVTTTPGATYDGASRRATSSNKLYIPGTASVPGHNDAVAATLSSPISQRPTACTSNLEQITQGPTALATVGTVRSGRACPSSTEETDDSEAAGTCEDWQQHDRRPMAHELETQQDESFFFQIRRPSGAIGAHEAADQALPDAPSQQSANPSVGEPTGLLPTTASTTDLRGGERARTSQVASEDSPVDDDDGACSGSGTGSPAPSSDIHDGESRSVMSSPAASEAGPASKQAPRDVDEAQMVSPIQSMEDDMMPFTPDATSTPAPTGARMSFHASAEKPTTGFERHAPRDTAQEDESDEVLDGGRVTPALSAGSLANQRAEPSTPHLEPEAHEPASFRSCLRDASAPEDQGDTPPRQSPRGPTDGTPREFSLKLLLNQLIPASPWAKLSQPSAGAGSTPIPEAKRACTRETWASRDGAGLAGSDSARSGPDAPSNAERSSSSPEDEPASNPRSPSTDSEADTVGSSQGQAAGNGVSDEGREPSEADTTVESLDEARITASQQSPWAKTQQLSQPDRLATATMTCMDDGQSSPTSPPPPGSGESQARAPPEAQSPWSRHADALPCAGTAPRLASSSPGAGADAGAPSGHSQEGPGTGSQPRPCTPEPQFTVKSFASFMSPSPECQDQPTGRAGSRLSLGTGALPSAMKNPWSGGARASARRVSWASLPHHQRGDGSDDGHGEPTSPPAAATPTPAPAPHGRARPVSPPPPPAATGALPVSETAKFSRHFAAVAGRSGDGLRRRLLVPTASQQARQSPGPRAMADKFLAADEAAAPAACTPPPPPPPPAARDAADDDMFRDMGDFLQAWDVDAELDRARRVATAAAAPLAASRPAGLAGQSPW